MDKDEIDALVRDVVGDHRLGEMIENDKWTVWLCGHSTRTMDKFVGRLKRQGVAAFCRPGKFGVLTETVQYLQ